MALLPVVGACSCSSTASRHLSGDGLTQDKTPVYPGWRVIRKNLADPGTSPTLKALSVVDIPLCFAVDTLLLLPDSLTD